MNNYPARRLPNGQFATDDYKRAVVDFYLKNGCHISLTAEKFSVSPSSVSAWVAIFADENHTQQQSAMKQPIEDPKSIDMDELSLCTPEEQIAKLKEALRRAEVRADLYDEMINVAEAKFKVGIRKKAGAKQ